MAPRTPPPGACAPGSRAAGSWMHARAGRLAAVDAGAAALGTALLVALRLIPQLLSPLAFGLLLACLLAGFGVDFLAWWLRGIRAVGLEADGLLLVRGARRASQRIDRTEISAVRVRRRWAVRRIEITLSAKAPGRRRRVVLTDDVFSGPDFERLASQLAAWG